MSGEDREGQQREVFGLDVVHCQICGKAVPTTEAIDVESQSLLSEHEERILICPSCWQRIHEGDLDLKTALAADEEDEMPPGA